MQHCTHCDRPFEIGTDVNCKPYCSEWCASLDIGFHVSLAKRIRDSLGATILGFKVRRQARQVRLLDDIVRAANSSSRIMASWIASFTVKTCARKSQE